MPLNLRHWSFKLIFLSKIHCAESPQWNTDMFQSQWGENKKKHTNPAMLTVLQWILKWLQTNCGIKCNRLKHLHEKNPKQNKQKKNPSFPLDLHCQKKERNLKHLHQDFSSKNHLENLIWFILAAGKIVLKLKKKNFFRSLLLQGSLNQHLLVSEWLKHPSFKFLQFREPKQDFNL